MAPIKRTNRANSTAEQDVCNKCSETIGGWIFCYSCRKWMHDKCCGISPELVQQITMIDNIQYVCGECLKSNEPINQKILDNTLDKVITPKIEVILSNFTDKLTEKFTEIAGTVSSSAQTYAAVASTPTTVPAISSPFDNTWTRELKIDGISENRGDFKSQTESDIHHITAILNHLGEDSFVKVRSFKRLGKRIATSTRPRTLLVEFTSQFDCVKVLSKAYKLQSFQSPIYISKSLSPTDQIKLRKILKLRTDVSTKDNIPKSDLKIKNLKLYHNNVEIPLPE